MSPCPLDGMRVLDLTWVLAGPIGTRVLADFGADVLKVESERRIDAIRLWPRPANPARHDRDTGAWYNDANAGKRSVTLDLSTEAGRGLARRVAARCDAVVDNFRPGVTQRLGLGYDDLRADNPRVVVVHLPGCADGPWAGRGTLGNQIAAAAGVNALTGFPGTPPSGLGVAYPDFVSPWLLATAVAAGVREARATGRGREVTVDQLAATFSLLGVEWAAYRSSGTEPARRANRDPNLCPHGVYPAAGDDRWIAIEVGSDGEWRALCDVAGIEPASFPTHDARKAAEDDVDAAVSAWTLRTDAWDAADALQSRGVAAAAVADVRDLVERDPQMASHWVRVRQPAAPDADITIHANPVRSAGTPPKARRAPVLFEHTQDVLRELLGLSEDEIDALIASGALS